MTDKEMALDALQRAESARQNQNTVVWTVFSIFAAALSVLVAPLVDAANKGKFWTGLVISIVGFVLSAFWGVLVERSIRFLSIDERVVMDIEKELKMKKAHSTTESNPAYKDILGDTWKAKKVASYITTFVIFAWFAAIVFFISRALC